MFPMYTLYVFSIFTQPARTKVKPQKEDLDQPLDRPAAISQFRRGWISNT